MAAASWTVKPSTLGEGSLLSHQRRAPLAERMASA